MAVLPGFLGCRPLRRTVQVRLGTNTLRLPGTRRKHRRCAWHAHLRGLATAIHEISGLRQLPIAVDPRCFVGEPGSFNVNLCRLLAEILADGFFQTFHLNQATGLGKSTE
jgi:hypothetical protein